MPHPATICAHNAPSQTYIPGVPVPCRKCGAPIMPQDNVSPGAIGEVQATYPGAAAVRTTP